MSTALPTTTTRSLGLFYPGSGWDFSVFVDKNFASYESFVFLDLRPVFRMENGELVYPRGHDTFFECWDPKNAPLGLTLVEMTPLTFSAPPIDSKMDAHSTQNFKRWEVQDVKRPERKMTMLLLDGIDVGNIPSEMRLYIQQTCGSVLCKGVMLDKIWSLEEVLKYDFDSVIEVIHVSPNSSAKKSTSEDYYSKLGKKYISITEEDDSHLYPKGFMRWM